MEYRELTEKIIGCAYHVHPVKWNDLMDIKNNGVQEGISTFQPEYKDVT